GGKLGDRSQGIAPGRGNTTSAPILVAQVQNRTSVKAGRSTSHCRPMLAEEYEHGARHIFAESQTLLNRLRLVYVIYFTKRGQTGGFLLILTGRTASNNVIVRVPNSMAVGAEKPSRGCRINRAERICGRAIRDLRLSLGRQRAP